MVSFSGSLFSEGLVNRDRGAHFRLGGLKLMVAGGVNLKQK